MRTAMHNKNWLMFGVLVNRFHQKSPETFLRSLPKEVSQKTSIQEVLSDEASLLIAQPEERLTKIHYSWLVEAFDKIPDQLKPSVLSSLTEETASGITQLYCTRPGSVNVDSARQSQIDLSYPVKRFLINTLYKNFEKREILPVPFIPKTTLSPLASLSKKQITKIIDFLGLYDLAEELRHIVDKNTLKNIYDKLSAPQQRFLRFSIHQKGKLVADRLNIELQAIDKKKLEIVLHKRGILRLAKALSGQHPDLVWHIAHTLDSGRGQLLLRYYQEEPISGISTALTLQVLNVIKFLKKSEA